MPLQGKIDVDRGVAMRQVVRFDDPANPNKFAPDLRYGGLTVYMYKDDPGVYYDVHGKPLPEHIAKSAGFPVDKLARQRKKKEALASLEAKLRQELELADMEEEVIAEAGGWKVVALPMDRAKVVDADTGDAVTPMPMPRADALALLEGLTATDAAVKKIKAKSE
jgi:hypothetical protein